MARFCRFSGWGLIFPVVDCWPQSYVARSEVGYMPDNCKNDRARAVDLGIVQSGRGGEPKSIFRPQIELATHTG